MCCPADNKQYDRPRPDASILPHRNSLTKSRGFLPAQMFRFRTIWRAFWRKGSELRSTSSSVFLTCLYWLHAKMAASTDTRPNVIYRCNVTSSMHTGKPTAVWISTSSEQNRANVTATAFRPATACYIRPLRCGRMLQSGRGLTVHTIFRTCHTA